MREMSALRRYRPWLLLAAAVTLAGCMSTPEALEAEEIAGAVAVGPALDLEVWIELPACDGASAVYGLRELAEAPGLYAALDGRGDPRCVDAAEVLLPDLVPEVELELFEREHHGRPAVTVPPEMDPTSTDGFQVTPPGGSRFRFQTGDTKANSVETDGTDTSDPDPQPV